MEIGSSKSVYSYLFIWINFSFHQLLILGVYTWNRYSDVISNFSALKLFMKKLNIWNHAIFSDVKINSRNLTLLVQIFSIMFFLSLIMHILFITKTYSPVFVRKYQNYEKQINLIKLQYSSNQFFPNFYILMQNYPVPKKKSLLIFKRKKVKSNLTCCSEIKEKLRWTWRSGYTFRRITRRYSSVPNTPWKCGTTRMKNLRYSIHSATYTLSEGGWMQAVCIRPDNSLRRAMVQVETSVEWEMKEAREREKER